jgi:site-specific recombinase XerD
MWKVKCREGLERREQGEPMQEQQSFFTSAGAFTAEPALSIATQALHAESTIADAIPQYQSYLRASGKSEHTLEGFSGDIKKLRDVFPGHKLSDLTTQDLRDFIALFSKRGLKTKTLCRRVTALKNFFRWLTGDKVLLNDPAAALVFARAIRPLPDILSKEEAERFMQASKTTPLEQVLVILVFGAGLKRNDIISLTTQNIDISDPLKPIVKIKARQLLRGAES